MIVMEHELMRKDPCDMSFNIPKAEYIPQELIKPDQIIVVGTNCTYPEDKIRDKIISLGFEKLCKIIISNNPTITGNNIFIMSAKDEDKIPSLNFEDLNIKGIPEPDEYILQNLPKIEDTSGYFKELERKTNKQNREELKWRSRYLSKRSKFRK